VSARYHIDVVLTHNRRGELVYQGEVLLWTGRVIHRSRKLFRTKREALQAARELRRSLVERDRGRRSKRN
jgi:hypothetical protein